MTPGTPKPSKTLQPHHDKTSGAARCSTCTNGTHQQAVSQVARSTCSLTACTTCTTIPQSKVSKICRSTANPCLKDVTSCECRILYPKFACLVCTEFCRLRNSQANSLSPLSLPGLYGSARDNRRSRLSWESPRSAIQARALHAYGAATGVECIHANRVAWHISYQPDRCTEVD